MRQGLLALVFGPSGAGKDSVLDAAARMLPADSPIVFARRAITRPDGAGGEAHEAITWPDFAARRAAGSFLLSWAANGHGYGIPARYGRMLDAGAIVVASVSRTVLADAASLRWPVLPIRITAPAPILAERLARRGREDAGAIAERLARAGLAEPEFGLAVHEIVNDGTLEDAAGRFLALVQRPNA